MLRWQSNVNDNRVALSQRTPTHIASIQDFLQSNPFVLNISEYADRVAGLDEILSICECTTSALRMKRNQYTEVSRSLPAEILEKVFMGVISQEEGSFACLPLGRVCRRWRTVALGCCQLWSHITTSSSTKLEELQLIIQRAKHTPLTVGFPDVSWEEDEDEDESEEDYESLEGEEHDWSLEFHRTKIFKHLLPLIPHARHLQMTTAPYWRIRNFIKEATAADAPYLVSVDLDLRSMYDAEIPLLSGTLPVLRHVTVNLASPGAALSLLRPTLVTLDMHIANGAWWSSNDARLAARLLSPLRSMRSLVVLKLQGIISTCVPLRFSDWQPICLPRLRKLQVADSVSPMSQFLDCVRIPSINVTQIDVFYDYINHKDEDGENDEDDEQTERERDFPHVLSRGLAATKAWAMAVGRDCYGRASRLVHRGECTRLSDLKRR